MTIETKNYFLAPSWDYAPNGLLALGNLILAPSRPVPPLHPAENISSEYPVIPTSKFGVEWTRGRETTIRFGVWAKFLQALGGVSIDTTVGKKNEEIYKFDRIDTEEFFPDEEFIRKSLSAPGVVRYLERTLFRRSVYMIVGIKTVRGAAIKKSAARSVDVQVEGEVDGTSFTGVPFSFGPKIGLGSSCSDSSSFQSSSDFVFAFRLRKVRVTPREVVQKDYNRGAYFDHSGFSGYDSDEDGGDKSPFESVGLEGCDVFGDEVLKVRDGEEDMCISMAVRE